MKSFARIDTQRQFRHLTLLCLASLLAVVILSSALYVRVILNRNHVFENHIIDQYRTTIDFSASEAEQLVRTLISDSAVTAYMRETDPARRYALGQQVRLFLSSVKAIQPEILDVFLIEGQPDAPTFLAMGESQGEITRRVADHRLPVVAGFYPYHTATGESTALYVGCDVYDISSLTAPESIGTIVAAMSLDRMDAALSDFGEIPGIYYAVLDEDMRPINGTTQYLKEGMIERIAPLCLEHRAGTVSSITQEVNAAPILDVCGTLLVYTRTFVVLSDTIRAVSIVLGITLAIYILLLLLFRSVRKSVAVPITRLTGRLAGEETPRELPVEGNDDVRSLIQTLNRLFSSEKYLSETLHATSARLREAELTRTRLELQFLRSQINPHFIYNSLEIIRSMAIVRKMPDLAEIAKSLAAILRYSIKGGDSVPLKEELDIARCYLSIQSIRFGHRFDYSMDVTPEAESALIPRMCLQPLIENAVTHGLEERLDSGHLAVRAAVEAGELVIDVSDNGQGIPPERLQALEEVLRHPDLEAPEQSGVGLSNVARRIHLARGNAFGISIDSAPGEGTTVTIRLPAGEEEQAGV